MKQIIRSTILNNDEVTQGFSTKDWGPLRPKGDWSDDGKYSDEVIERNKLFFDSLAIDYDDTVGLNQTHSDIVHVVGAPNKGERIRSNSIPLEGDAMITQESCAPLIIRVADCVPVFFYDPVAKVIGVAHSGWVGTYAEICKKTINAMIDNFGIDTKNLRAYIGPCIAGRNYNVDVNRTDRKEANEYFVSMRGANIVDNMYYIDLREVVRNQLINAGVSETNIEVSSLCTFEQENLYSSRRRDMPSNNIGVIMLK